MEQSLRGIAQTVERAVQASKDRTNKIISLAGSDDSGLDSSLPSEGLPVSNDQEPLTGKLDTILRKAQEWMRQASRRERQARRVAQANVQRNQDLQRTV